VLDAKGCWGLVLLGVLTRAEIAPAAAAKAKSGKSRETVSIFPGTGAAGKYPRDWLGLVVAAIFDE
jgi:hypothetical protein